MTPEFLITSLIIAASPGTGVVYTLAAGLSQGSKASVVAAFGCTLGIVPHLLAAITGLAAILHASALAFGVIKYLGVAYLLYMAWNTLREDGALKIDDKQEHRKAGRVIGEAILINLLNPKLSIFFFAFLPQFIAPEEVSPTWSMVDLGLIFMAMTFLVFALYGCFAASVRRQVVARPAVLTWLRRSFAAAFVALGAKLALTQR
ncbi:RhtB family transporter, putative homoserine/homoserine lactone efflux protein [Agrobacterium fabacearum S56]|uniref:LysE family translocator n=1 Tax=Agrobacterium tumefaciens TaxID=358 RepID=UPI0009BB7AEA|nr:LysE family translocator [Agrobacterium tumefaciens]NSY47611.1 LysE family translocator [Agrobacterium tumefaciens]CUW88306.1 RhtB family transporter, putative homoserine/homoserine lactone efflux protein [Agrobacterium fabacearum S56]